MDRKYKTIMFLGLAGGVGKSTILANTAYLMAQNQNKKIGIIDLNINSPRLPFLFSIEDRKLGIENKKIKPVKILSNLFIISNEFFIKEKDMPIIIRKYMTSQIVKQFVNDVDWNEFDYIFIDTPPSFSDEILVCLEEFKKIDLAIIISNNQNRKEIDMQREYNFTKQYGIDLLGVIENMNTISINGNTHALFNYDKIENNDTNNEINKITTIPYNENIFISYNLGITYIEKFKDDNDIRYFNTVSTKIMEYFNKNDD